MQNEITVAERIAGGFWGGAIGDALGEPVEFLSAAQRLERWGPQGVQGYVHDGWGRFTDDTQMTLFTAEALIVQAQSGEPLPIALHKAYLRWLLTQEIQPKIHPDRFSQEGFLLDYPELYQRMGPGRTCITALHAAWELGMPAINDSKGCGGLMRVAPIGFWAALHRNDWSTEKTFQVGSLSAQLTHGHPCGYLSAGAFAVLLQELCVGTPLSDAIALVSDYLGTLGEVAQDTKQAVNRAVQLTEKGKTWEQAITEMGAGWVAEEILAITVFLGLTADNFESGILKAANHPGDADSVGAIAGQLLGAECGLDVRGHSWVTCMRDSSVVNDTLRYFGVESLSK